MALWPFNRRKRGGSRSAEPAVDAPNMGISTRITAQDPKQVRREAKSTSRTRSRQPSKSRVVNVDSNEQLEKNSTDGLTRSSGQADSTNGRTPLAEVQNPVAALPKPSPLKDVARAASPTSLQKAATEPITPTLQNKRSRGAQEGMRSKSTKRRAEDKDRLQEIKTMSAPIPVPKRPRSITQSSSPLAQDNRKIRNGLNRNFERPMSEVSLPLAESLRSSFSGTLEMSSSYRVSPFDALSPRPRIHYSDGARHASESFIPSRTSTRKEKGPAIPEEDFHPRARIDKLADEMDAASLRELMERDRRRRERKKRSDRDKLERRLESKAEKQERRAQRKAAAAAAAAAESSTKNESEDVQMRDAEEAGPSGGQSPPANRVASPSSFLGERSQQLPEPKEPVELEEAPQPVIEEESEPVEETPRQARPTTPPPQSSPVELPADVPAELPASDSGTNLALITPVTTPRQAASSPEPKESPAARARDVRRDVDGPSRWKAIFRRSGTKGRGSSEKSRGTPSEFSNTSRESFARQQKEKVAAGAAAAAALPPPPPPPPPAIPREPPARSASNTPRRTKSKFREDLPEFVSPPASHHSGGDTPRSPVSPVSPGYGNGQNDQPLNKEYFSSGDAEAALQEGTGLARNHSQRSGSPEVQPTGMLSQSLASVDSEGSWLSGRPPKRSSLPISKREGDDSISEQVGESSADREQDPTYFARRDPTNGLLQMQQSSGIAAQLARGLQSPDDAESTPTSARQSPTDDNLRGGQVAGHQPMVVRSDPAHRSRVGLIEMLPSGEEASPRHNAGVTIERTGSPDEEAVSVHEARSVDYNKGLHSRRVSAGSARILEIPGRDKRHSGLSVGAASATSSRNSPAIPQRTWEEDKPDQALSADDEPKKGQNVASVENAGGTTRAPGLGLGLRLGARPVSGQSATSETNK